MARWQDAVAVDPSDAALFEMLAQAAMAVCEDFRAVQFAAEATRLAPDWSAASHTLARAHLNFGELSLARANIDKVKFSRCIISVSICNMVMTTLTGDRAQRRRD